MISNGVQLLDEYDSIHRSIEGMHPVVLRSKQAEIENWPDMFTIGKLPGGQTVRVLRWPTNDTGARLMRAEHQVELLEDVADWMPEFKVTHFVEDRPRGVVSWEMKDTAIQAGRCDKCMA